ncbi:MAG: type II secretion system minor pseudopilin GspI [Gammaproteobacteria bacterium]
MHAPATRGFTLIEVLIALAVLAIGMIAVISTAGTSTRQAAELRDETFAHWVAMNELTTLRLAPAWPDIGTQKGTAEMAGQKWNWQATASTTSDPDLLRIDIDVSSALAPAAVITGLTGFMGRPQPLIPGQPTSGDSNGSSTQQ